MANRLSEWWNTLSKASKFIAVVLPAITGPLAVWKAYDWLRPHFEITPALVVDNNDAALTEFEVRNTGNRAATKVDVSCELDSNTNHYKFRGVVVLNLPDGTPGIPFRDEIPPGGSATMNCNGGIGIAVPFPAKIKVVVHFSWPLWGRQIVSRDFRSRRDSDGKWKVLKDS